MNGLDIPMMLRTKMLNMSENFKSGVTYQLHNSIYGYRDIYILTITCIDITNEKYKPNHPNILLRFFNQSDIQTMNIPKLIKVSQKYRLSPEF
jgi:hypothetical protein